MYSVLFLFLLKVAKENLALERSSKWVILNTVKDVPFSFLHV